MFIKTKSNNKIEKSNLLNSEIIFTYFANCVNPIQQPLHIRFRDMYKGKIAYSSFDRF